MCGHGEQLHWPGGAEFSAFYAVFIVLVVLAEYGLLCWLNMDVRNEKHTWPFMASIAVVAAAASSKVTKPKPRERPVYLSTMTLACRRTRGFANQKTGERGFADLHSRNRLWTNACSDCANGKFASNTLTQAPVTSVQFPLHCMMIGDQGAEKWPFFGARARGRMVMQKHTYVPAMANEYEVREEGRG